MYSQEYAHTNHTHTVMSKHTTTNNEVERNSGTVATNRLLYISFTITLASWLSLHAPPVNTDMPFKRSETR